MGTIILSAFVAHTGWHWTLERVDRLRQFQFGIPTFDAALWLNIVRWLTLIVAFAALGWVAALLQRRFIAPSRK
jgi:hypothetical protein